MKSSQFIAIAVALVGLLPVAGAQSSNNTAVNLMVGDTVGVWQTTLEAGQNAGADTAPMAFALRSNAYPSWNGSSGTARVILLARVIAPTDTLTAITAAFGAQSGIDLAPDPANLPVETALFQTGDSAWETHVELVGSPLLKMHAASTQALFATLKSKAAGASWSTDFPAELNKHSIPWSTTATPFPAQPGSSASFNYGLAMPANNPEWVVGGFAEKFWPQSFLGRYLNSATTPGGTLTVFSPSRLVERCILNQSTNSFNAATFIRSASYRNGFSNQFTLDVQALVVLPAESIASSGPVPARRKIKVIKTDVYRRQVTLTPGTDDPLDEAPEGSLALRPGIMFDFDGMGGPVCFNLGLGVDPISATFAVPGENSVPIVVPVFKLYPWDALSTYYIALRPSDAPSKIVNIGVTVPNAVPADPPVFILPPLADALPVG